MTMMEYMWLWRHFTRKILQNSFLFKGTYQENLSNSSIILDPETSLDMSPKTLSVQETVSDDVVYKCYMIQTLSNDIVHSRIPIIVYNLTAEKWETMYQKKYYLAML